MKFSWKFKFQPAILTFSLLSLSSCNIDILYRYHIQYYIMFKKRTFLSLSVRSRCMHLVLKCWKIRKVIEAGPQLNKVFGRRIWHKMHVWVWAFCSLAIPKIYPLRHVNRDQWFHTWTPSILLVTLDNDFWVLTFICTAQWQI